MLPEPSPAPAGSGDEDSWGWLVTFSDLVLQLFGVAVLAAVGGAAAHVATADSAPVAVAAPAVATQANAASAPSTHLSPAASASSTQPSTAPADVHEVLAVAAPVERASSDDDALPVRTADDDRLPAAPAAVAAPHAPVAMAASAPQDAELLAIGRYLEQLAGRERALAAQVATRPGEVVVEIGAMNGFRPGSADPVPAMRPLLAEVRSLLAASPTLHVEISGHTDDVPIRTAAFPSNLELSLARASRVAQELTGGDATLRTRISAAGYGEQRPLASNADAHGRARNRRVEIRLTRAS